jgi:phenylpropionate dioxygenase-like ring-hydroxylating dioxygenase large terminal subunit
MLPEESDLLTRTDRGTPGGDLLRRYWQPVALSEELPSGGAPLPVKLLGEELVLFRDEAGKAGLLGLHCSHRGADLSYGRLEDGGLRCIYHGWLYDIHGRCLDQPGEPGGGEHKDAIRHPAYPCREAAGVIFAYLGPGEPPLLPNYEFLTTRDDHVFAIKHYHECNYLQSSEGNIDPVHLSYLHRRLDGGGRDNGDARSESGGTQLVGRDIAPTTEVELTDFGARIYTVRKIPPDKYYLRVSNFVFPNLSAFPGQTGSRGYSVNWHVPIDDTHHWKYVFIFSREASLDKDAVRRARVEMTPDYKMTRNKANRYRQDRDSMKSATYSGIGFNFQAQDACATEGAGPVEDRTKEHLVSSDKAIVAARKLLLKAVQDLEESKDPPHVAREGRRNSFSDLVVLSELLSDGTDWKEYTRKRVSESKK